MVTAAALIMTAVFSGFIFAGQTLVMQIGMGLAVAVLFDAFVVLRGWRYRPDEPSTAPRPVIVISHGYGAVSGSRNTLRRTRERRAAEDGSGSTRGPAYAAQ